MNRPDVSLAITAVAVVSTATIARAATGHDYGTHVTDCAQTMGFSAGHNPGMHHGYAGRPGDTCDTHT